MPTKQVTKPTATSATLDFSAPLIKINSWTILLLPKEVSAKLPSRGQAMVQGTFNGLPLQTPLEPDGNWNHWFKVDEKLLKAAHVAAGDTVALSLAVIPNKAWPEPDVPDDLQTAISADHQAHDLWQQVTPMAHWEWIRWVRSTGRQETRDHRIEVAISKLKSGERRPCCWNRNLSTEPAVSKNGVLLTPQQASN